YPLLRDSCDTSLAERVSICRWPFHAQSKLDPYAGAEDNDLRNSRQPGAVAKNSTALSLHPIPGARGRSQRCGDGCAAFGYSDLMDIRANDRSRQLRNPFSSSESLDQR